MSVDALDFAAYEVIAQVPVHDSDSRDSAAAIAVSGYACVGVDAYNYLPEVCSP